MAAAGWDKTKLLAVISRSYSIDGVEAAMWSISLRNPRRRLFCYYFSNKRLVNYNFSEVEMCDEAILDIVTALNEDGVDGFFTMMSPHGNRVDIGYLGRAPGTAVDRGEYNYPLAYLPITLLPASEGRYWTDGYEALFPTPNNVTNEEMRYLYIV